MTKTVEVSRENRTAYLKVADICVRGDDTLLDALDAAIETPDNDELFTAFCALLDAKGIVVTTTETSRQEQTEEKAYQAYVAKNPSSNRGKTY